MFVFRSRASRCYWSPGWVRFTRWLKRRSLPRTRGGWGYQKKISTRNLERRNRREQRRFILTPFHLNSPWNCTANQSPFKTIVGDKTWPLILRYASVETLSSTNVNISFLTTGSRLICGFLSENSKQRGAQTFPQHLEPAKKTTENWLFLGTTPAVNEPLQPEPFADPP